MSERFTKMEIKPYEDDYFLYLTHTWQDKEYQEMICFSKDDLKKLKQLLDGIHL